MYVTYKLISFIYITLKSINHITVYSYILIHFKKIIFVSVLICSSVRGSVCSHSFVCAWQGQCQLISPIHKHMSWKEHSIFYYNFL